MMHSGLIVIGALIVRTQALKGQDFPIPTEELYENYTWIKSAGPQRI